MGLADTAKKLMKGRSAQVERAIDTAVDRLGTYSEKLKGQADTLKTKARQLDDDRGGPGGGPTGPVAASPAVPVTPSTPAAPPPAPAAPAATPAAPEAPVAPPEAPAPPAPGGLRGDLARRPEGETT